MAKYKVGDKVLVRSDLECHKTYGSNGVIDSVVEEMMEFCGKAVTISTVFDNGKYRIKEDDCGWNFVEEMFVGLAEDSSEHKYKIGDKVKLRSGLTPRKKYNGITFLKEMERYVGFTGEIRGDVESTSPLVEFYEPDNHCFFLGVDMIEPASDTVTEKHEPRYKVGDKVRIKKDLTSGDYDCANGGKLWCNHTMTAYAGEIATITYVDHDGDYNLDVDDEDWCWSDGMLEDYVEEVKETKETTYASYEEELFKKFIEKDKTLAKFAKILHERHNMSYKQIALVMIESSL